MAETDTKQTSAYDSVIEQHDELREMSASLRDFLAEPRPEPGKKGAHTWATTLSEQLLALHDKLFVHFRYEEQTGFLEDLARNFPRATHQTEALARDHDRILQDVGALLSAAICYSSGQAPDNPQLRRWGVRILDRLSCHEREETDLYQRMLYEELGTGD